MHSSQRAPEPVRECRAEGRKISTRGEKQCATGGTHPRLVDDCQKESAAVELAGEKRDEPSSPLTTERYGWFPSHARIAATVSSALPMLTALLKKAASSVRCPLWISPFWEPGILRAERISPVRETPTAHLETANSPVEVDENVHAPCVGPLHSELEVPDLSSVDEGLI